MKAVILAAMAATILAFATVGRPAHSQTMATGTLTPTAGTPLPTASATGTVTVPGGQDLLNAMATAVTAKNSYHIVTDETGVSPKVAKVTIHLHGDASVKPLLAHEYETAHNTDLTKHPAARSTTHEQLVLVKKKFAMRTRGQAWQCTTLQAVGSSTSGALGNTLGSTKIKSLTDLGSETVNTIPVWHVRVTVSVGTSSPPQILTENYYISQADHTLVRQTAAGTLSLLGIAITENVITAYTNYGEVVHVKLPKACAGKALTTDALAPDLRQPLGNPAIWLPLVRVLRGR